MNTKPDPAAELAAAISLKKAVDRMAQNGAISISARFEGYDNFMRHCMVAGRDFESWACKYVDFNSLNEVWPYHVEDTFGDAFLKIVPLDCFGLALKPKAYLDIAHEMKLPIRPETAQVMAMEKGEKWNDNSIQFPRLIAELEAAGAFENGVWGTVCDSMDISLDQFIELVSRASKEWREIKAKL